MFSHRIDDTEFKSEDVKAKGPTNPKNRKAELVIANPSHIIKG